MMFICRLDKRATVETCTWQGAQNRASYAICAVTDSLASVLLGDADAGYSQ